MRAALPVLHEIESAQADDEFEYIVFVVENFKNVLNYLYIIFEFIMLLFYSCVYSVVVAKNIQVPAVVPTNSTLH